MATERVTSQTVAIKAFFQINRNLSKLANLQEKIATGKDILVPSDAPFQTSQAMSHRTRISAIDQYMTNIEHGRNVMQITSETIDLVIDILQDINDEASMFASDPQYSSQVPTYVTSLDLLLNELVQAGNKKFLGKFLFGGTETLSGTQSLAAPFNPTYNANNQITGVVTNPRGIDGVRTVLTEESNTVRVNVSGTTIFRPNGTGAYQDIFQVAIDIRNAISGADLTSLRNELQELDSVLEHLFQENAEVGSRVQKIDREELRLRNNKVLSVEQRSMVEDADMVDLIMQLRLLESNFEASLKAFAGVIQPSILNFI